MKPKTYTLRNRAGMALKVSTLGGTVVSLTAPDRDGKSGETVLSYPDVTQHLPNGHMNSLIGRVANRIGGGVFTLDGEKIVVAKNDNGVNSLHGGEVGFDQKIWDARPFAGADGPSLELTLFSPDGEEGYPGNLFLRVVYTLTEDNAWRIEYWAITDKTTVINFTNHAYFNLSGGKDKDLDGHYVQVNASRFTEVDKRLIPTGRVLPVEGTGLDLRSPMPFHECFAHGTKDKYMKAVGGYDHNFIIDRVAAGLAQAAVLEHPESGRQMEVWTTEPCVQVYTGNFLNPEVTGSSGFGYGPHAGVCFETQHAPDSPNQPGFPSIRLEPGQVYYSATIYAFDVVED